MSQQSHRDPYKFGERIENAVTYHAQRTPDAVALQQGSHTVTYGQLCRDATVVTAELRSRGIGTGDYVPVQLERSPEFVTALLGVLGAGAAYIALDSSWPQERIDDIVARCDGRLRLDNALLNDPTSHAHVPGADRQTDGTAAACVFFTSGSTGEPKGVISPHRGTIRTLVDCPTIPLNTTTVFLQAAPLPWDGMALELWAPLLNGGRCVLLDRGVHTLDADALRTAIAEGVNSIWLTSSLFNVFADEDPGLFDGVRLLLVGGERVSVTHVRRVLTRFPDLHLVNGYGPVEATIFTTTHVFRGCDIIEGATDAPIGRPVPQTEVTLVTAEGTPIRPEDVGQIGEIMVSGDGLALGYLADPDETARRFVNLDGVRHYRTGDLACYDREANLRYRGRADRQFKIRGVRIEPGEIEAVLESHPTISSSCVLRIETASGRAQLGCVYSTVDGMPLADHLLREFATRKLLDAMVPSLIHHVPQLPLAATGKTDHAAVRQILLAHVEGDRVQPTNDTDAGNPLLADAREFLDLPTLTAQRDLVEAGLTSLDAVRLAARASARLTTHITVADIYRLRSLDKILAAPRRSSSTEVAPPSLRKNADGPAPLSHAQERFWLAEQISPGDVDNLIVLAYVLTGPLSPETLEAALHDVIALHPVLRTVYPCEDDLPVQQVLPSASTRVPLESVAPPPATGPADRDLRAVAEAITSDWWSAPFALEAEIPVRARLCHIDSGQHLLCLQLHHIAFDGWSERHFINDLCASYAERSGQATARTSADSLTYADYSRWERSQLHPWSRAELPFWTRTLANPPAPCLPLPVSEGPAHRLEDVLCVVADTVQCLARAAGRHGGPPVAVLVAATARALSRTFDASDLCLGSVAAGRHLPNLQSLIGYFVNPVAVSMASVAECTKAALLDQAVEGVVSALEHARTPFDHLVRILRPSRERHPWFQIWVVLQNEPARGRLGERTSLAPIRVRPPRTSIELTVEAVPQHDGSWELVIARRADGCDDAQFKRLVEALAEALDEFALLGRGGD